MPAALKILFVYMSEHIFSYFVVACVCFQETCMHSNLYLPKWTYRYKVSCKFKFMLMLQKESM